ncbi:MAG: hypothetical protein LC776_01340, partial [Acidobacteria bacterium]|nr:hypothetical protein [Acidobacteriota bacterium]
LFVAFLPVALLFGLLSSKIPGFDMDPSIPVPPWVVAVVAVVVLYVAVPLYVLLSVTSVSLHYRASDRIIRLLNSLERSAYDVPDCASSGARQRLRVRLDRVSELRTVRDELERIGWQISADTAELSGDRAAQRQDERHSRLSRLCNWVADDPYSAQRRRALFVACSLYAERLETGSALTSLPIAIPAGDIRPARRKRRIRRGLFELVSSLPFLVGVSVAVITIVVQFAVTKLVSLGLI